MSRLLENRTILITGSSRGIGAATARLAKGYGARVILHGKEKTRELRSAAKALDAEYIACDVRNEPAVTRAVRAVLRRVRNVDALVNCAGITNPKTSFFEQTEQEWVDVFRVNVLGTVHFCKAIIPSMKKQRSGRIVNIASIRGYGITSGRAAYSASKSAIINLTATLAKEFAPDIAVNAVAPGFTNTAMSKTWDKAIWKQVESALLKRVAEPEEIAEVVLFLISDRASFITGQTILVDGGYSIAGK